MLSRQRYVGRQRALFHAAGNSCNDYGGTVSVADVILNNQSGANAALLTAHYRRQIRIENIASAHIHAEHLRNCM